MISWSFIKNQVALIQWDYREFLDSKVDTIEDSGNLGSELTTANHNELKDMFAFEWCGPIVELGIVKAMQKANCKFAIIQIPGSTIAREFTIRSMNYMEKNPNCAVLGQVLHKIDSEGDRWWGIMPYTMVVNLEHFQKAGRLFFGNRRDRPEQGQLFPDVIDNEGKLSSSGKDVEIDCERLFYGWYWIAKFLQVGQEVHSLDDRINPFRQYVYYENKDDMNKHNWLMENMPDYVEDGEAPDKYE
jgi:hypothetical protein